MGKKYDYIQLSNVLGIIHPSHKLEAGLDNVPQVVGRQDDILVIRDHIWYQTVARDGAVSQRNIRVAIQNKQSLLPLSVPQDSSNAVHIDRLPSLYSHLRVNWWLNSDPVFKQDWCVKQQLTNNIHCGLQCDDFVDDVKICFSPPQLCTMLKTIIDTIACYQSVCTFKILNHYFVGSLIVRMWFIVLYSSTFWTFIYKYNLLNIQI